MASWKAKSVIDGTVANGPLVVAASQTDAPLTGTIPVRSTGNILCVIDVHVSAVTVTTAVTLKVQDSADGANWSDKKTLAVTTTGWKNITFNNWASGDQTYLPLRSLARLVVETGTGDTVSVADVLWTQDWSA